MRDFFRRHSRLLSLIGALIVFMTFITKEQLREKWKSTADALSTAQYFFALHDENELALTWITRLPEKPMGDLKPGESEEQYQAAVAKSPYQTDRVWWHIYHNQNVRWGKLLTIESHVADNLEPVAEQLHDRKELEQVHALQSCFDETMRDVAAADQSSLKDQEEVEVPGLPMAETLDAAKDRRAKEVKLYIARQQYEAANRISAWLKLNKEVKRVRVEVLAKANAERVKDERRSIWAGWISNFLYVVGWGLGLAGKLSGTDGELLT
jgi:hypothetical protein